MKALASLLLVLVVITHYGYSLLAGLYENPEAAARAWFYVLRGVEGTALYCIVWSIAPKEPVYARYGIALACAWGAVEEAQTAVCRLAIGIENKTVVPELYQGLCDAVTGWPVYMFTITSALLVAALRFRRE